MNSTRVERRGGGVPTWVLALLATVMVLGFMAWLMVTAEPSNPAARDDGAVADDTVSSRAQQIPAVVLDDFARDPRQYEGTEVRLAAVPVDSRLGERSFWLKLPNQGLYLVRGTGQNAARVRSGQRVSVAGPILPMTDSVVTAWLGDGSITADQEMQARFATSYIEAWYVSTEQQRQEGAASAAQEG